MTITSSYDVRINEEYRQLVPEMSEVEFQTLKESIKLQLDQ
jgi:hypothetical protein